MKFHGPRSETHFFGPWLFFRKVRKRRRVPAVVGQRCAKKPQSHGLFLFHSKWLQAVQAWAGKTRDVYVYGHYSDSTQQYQKYPHQYNVYPCQYRDCPVVARRISGKGWKRGGGMKGEFGEWTRFLCISTMSILGSIWQEHDWESSILGYWAHFVETATLDETSDIVYGTLTCLYILPKSTHKLVFFELCVV